MAALDIEEKQGGFARDHHLRVETAALEFLGAFDQRIAERGGFIESAVIHLRGRLVEARVERIEKDDSAFGEQARGEFAEGGAKSVVRGVRLAKGLGDGIGIRAFERGGGLADQCLNIRPENNFADAAAHSARGGLKLEFVQALCS